MEPCRKASEKYWHKLAEQKVVFNLLPAEDIDLDADQINIDYDDLDQKLELSD